jgi:hypothetical protein
MSEVQGLMVITMLLSVAVIAQALILAGRIRKDHK